MFMSPVVYPPSLVPERWQTLYAMNPMVPVIEGIRYAAFGTGYLTLPSIACSIVAACVLLVSGLAYFRSAERTLADAI
jgi:lipopolysaccharide transport system permease protein